MRESEQLFNYFELVGILKRRKWVFLSFFFSITAASIVIAILLPPTYRSQAKVLVERQQIPSELVTTTVTGYVEERIETLSQRVLTNERLKSIAEKYGLLEPLTEGQDPEDVDYRNKVAKVINTISENTLVEMVDIKVATGQRQSTVTLAFTVAYENRDPEVARNITNAITQLYLSENTVLRSEQASRATEFLSDAADKLSNEIAEIEAEINELKEENFAYLPAQLSQARAQLTALEGELRNLNREISYMEAQKQQLISQLATTSRFVITDNSSIREYQDPLVRLEKAKLDLSAALESLTEQHPDVQRLRQLIKDIEKETQSSSGSRKDLNNLTAPNNPEFIRIQTQLNQNDTKLLAAIGDRKLLQERINELTNQLMQNPGIEVKYTALIRDLERAQNEYKDIKERYYQAQLAQTLEKKEQGSRFTLLSKATTPILPVKPNRIGISLLGIFIALLASGSATVYAESRDSRIRTARDLQKITGTRPISVIPIIGQRS